MAIPDSELVKYAQISRNKAYAPYSRFAVGAALETKSGRRFDGCNIENRSYGLTICAERVALGAAVSAGETDLQLLAIVSDSEELVVPCGACRQVLAEFNPNLRILSSNLQGKIVEFQLSTLLPLPAQGILG